MLTLTILIVSVYSIKIAETQKITVKVKKNIIGCGTNKKVFDEEIFFTNENWRLEIPKIGLNAVIDYGTTQAVMNKYIGHFDETKLWNGNIGLAAHNRGYPVNYFARIKELQIGDEIKYTTIFGTKTYIVKSTTIIDDTDWSYLKNTIDNRITLITCVENEPNYRRCIQAIEV